MQVRLKELDKEAYATAATSLDEQYKTGNPSASETIESLAGWGVPSSLKGSLGLLARELVSHIDQREEYRMRCRALGLGAFALLMLSERAEGSLSFLYGRGAYGLDYRLGSASAADMTLDIAETTAISLGQMGEQAHDWIKARSKEVGLPQKEEFWFTVGASRALDHMRFAQVMSRY